ncbi:hypothetical protein C2G38_2103427 [Gigaspora rosea]|uniref:C2H2-type domain-containing protein n=1 Tax=Gigaspora rosea TaxID=44941 RepID=A0A397UMP0_9GLOM|nr:hypothetical protein C2G38_2103427 [Gigaspora rosea]
MTSISSFPCLLCSKTYNTKKKLQSHKRNKHKNNKLIHIQKYQCVLESTEGEEQLKHIFKYDEIIFCEDINASTWSYILFENNNGQYKITFSWKQKKHKENNRIFLTGTLLINFIANSRKFINEKSYFALL